MSVWILQNPSESINYFSETYSIRTLILINFTDNIIIKTTVWENWLINGQNVNCSSKYTI